MSKLTKAAVYPRKVEKQKVSLALKVFCDVTAAALTQSEVSTDSFRDTEEIHPSHSQALEVIQLQEQVCF